MDFQDCIKFASENPQCYLATTEAGQPRVRPLKLWFADEKGFYFQTQAVKALYKQLKNNRKVEVCFYRPDPNLSTGKAMRVAGEVEFIDDIALKARVLEDRPFLKEEYGVKSPEDPMLVVFRIHTGEAFFWTREYSMRESEIERIRF